MSRKRVKPIIQGVEPPHPLSVAGVFVRKKVGCNEFNRFNFRIHKPSVNLRSNIFIVLNHFLAWAPLVLQTLIQARLINIFGPPLAPAGKKDLIRVLWEVVTRKGTQNILTT
jgi:hypothetical protein